jgi:hypothetical protein
MGEVSGGVERFYWLLKSLRDPAQLFFSIGLTASLTVAGFVGLPGIWTWPAAWWLVIAAAFAIVWVVGRLTFLRPTYADLARRAAQATREAEEKRSAIQRSLEAIIRRIALHVFKDAIDSRISAYSVEGDEFVLLARHSSDPTLERRGRPSYPMRQGAIGAAWSKKSSLFNSAAESRADWESEIARTEGFTVEEARALTMHARSICAVRLDNGPEKVGVIVLESETHQKFGVAELRRVRDSLLLDAAAEVVAVAHDHFPRVEARRNERDGSRESVGVPEPKWKSPDPAPLDSDEGFELNR